MTTLVALATPSAVWFGCDRMTGGDGMKSLVETKWVHGLGQAIGIAGDAVTIHVISENYESLVRDTPSPIVLGRRLRQMFIEAGFNAGVNGPGAPVWGQELLYVRPGLVVSFDNAMFGIVKEQGEIVAAGSGRDFALGAGFATREMDDPEARVRIALMAGCHFDECSGEPIWLGSITLQPGNARPKAARAKKQVA
jgi:hypothetical protein